MSTKSQAVTAPLTRSAIFLVVRVKTGHDGRRVVRSLCADLGALIRSVGFRSQAGKLSCVMGIGADAWDRCFGLPRPAELHPFREIRAGRRHAVATPGDLLFHLRADHFDLCFELGSQILTRLGDAVMLVDEVHGFRYFDNRDLLGFVDGTENPQGQGAVDATLIGEEDAAFAGGSYVIVQKYVHDKQAEWDTLPTEEQEGIIGRTKLADIELDDARTPSNAHRILTTIEENGKEIKIVRDNMAFGMAGTDRGTYFIGYSRSPRTIEQMLDNMFIGRPPGNYDRLLDFTRPVTGNLFFVPTATFLESVIADELDAGVHSGSSGREAAPPDRPVSEGSLGRESPM